MELDAIIETHSHERIYQPGQEPNNIHASFGG